MNAALLDSIYAQINNKNQFNDNEDLILFYMKKIHDLYIGLLKDTGYDDPSVEVKTKDSTLPIGMFIMETILYGKSFEKTIHKLDKIFHEKYQNIREDFESEEHESESDFVLRGLQHDLVEIASEYKDLKDWEENVTCLDHYRK